MKIGLVFLTLNEIDGLSSVFPKINLNIFDEAFAVDGGSTDGTLQFYEENNFKVYTQSSTGRGDAFRVAFQKTKCDALVFFSPDGNEDVNDLHKFRPLFGKGYDLVIASRMMKGAYNEEDSQIFKFRKWANNAFNLLANIFFRKEGVFITDSINGFRGITKAAFQKIRPDGSGYTIEYQMTIKAFKNKLKIFEFPTHEYERLGGESYAKSIPTGIAFLKLFFRELFS